MAPTVLVIYGSAEIGLAIIRTTAESDPKPPVHAFTQAKSKIPAAEAEKAASVIEGDASSAADVERALEESKADFVVLCVGTREFLGPTDVREKSAKALMEVLKPGGKYEHVKIVVISALGAGGTKIIYGLGVGMRHTKRLKNVLADHDKQQEEIWGKLGEEHKKRCWVVHVSNFRSGFPDDEVQEFEGRVPLPKIDRVATAKYILAEIAAGCPSFGKAVCITHKKKKK